MTAQQLHLFAPPKPLLQRLGAEFFRAVPREPGVYIMTGSNERVLYIGQSGNLRARLGSYKNARPDRVPRKIIRLVHAVERITWEKCGSAEAARLRENELLRLHRPKFNALNTYPQAYSFIFLKSGPAGLELGRTNRPETGGQLFGAFKTRALAGFGALLRLTWAALHQPHSPQDFPLQLLSAKPPRQYLLLWKENPALPGPEPLLDSLRSFLDGVSDGLLELLAKALPAPETLSPFQRALQLNDLEILAEFYRFGPQRNHELKIQHQLPDRLIRQEQLDDLLARSRSWSRQQEGQDARPQTSQLAGET